jgi:hypothetical protein
MRGLDAEMFSGADLHKAKASARGWAAGAEEPTVKLATLPFPGYDGTDSGLVSRGAIPVAQHQERGNLRQYNPGNLTIPIPHFIILCKLTQLLEF